MIFIKNGSEQYFRRKCNHCKNVVYAELDDFLINEYNRIECPKCKGGLYLTDFHRTTKRKYLKELSKIDDISAKSISREELCEKVRELCNGASEEFLFIVNGKSCWSVSENEHIRAVAKYHKETEENE